MVSLPKAKLSMIMVLLLIGSASTTFSQKLANKYKFYCVTEEAGRYGLKNLCSKLTSKDCRAFAIDTETDGRNRYECNCVGLSVCMREGEAFYIPFGHTPLPHLTDSESSGNVDQLTRETVLKYLKPIMENPKIGKYMHNATFDMAVLYNMGIDTKGLVFDSLVAARLIAKAKGIKRSNGLKYLSESFFGETMLGYVESVYANGCNHFGQLTLGIATPYAAADAHQTLKVTEVLQRRLRKRKLRIKEETVNKVYYGEKLPKIIEIYEENKYKCKNDWQRELEKPIVQKKKAPKGRKQEPRTNRVFDAAHDTARGVAFARAARKRKRKEFQGSRKRRKTR